MLRVASYFLKVLALAVEQAAKVVRPVMLMAENLAVRCSAKMVKKFGIMGRQKVVLPRWSTFAWRDRAQERLLIQREMK